MAWPQNPRWIGGEITRLDGIAKASGKAKYPSDQNPKGLLFGVMLYSPHAHAKVTSIDVAPAEKVKGVKAIVEAVKAGATLRFQGEVIAAVAAETEEAARDAVKAIKIEYEVLPHVVTEAQALDPKSPEVFKGRGIANNARKGAVQKKGDAEAGLAKADVKIEGTYSAPVITHVCLETHGLTAKWEGKDKIVAWASTQAVQVTANELAGRFNVPVTNVTVLTDVMGGGFGSKFGADQWGQIATELSQKADGAPVKMFLDRAHEHLAAGNRPSAFGTVKIGATKDGKITGMIAETHGTGGAAAGANFPMPYVYSIDNTARSHADVFVNGGGARAMRAPGHPQGCFIMESAMDDLGEALGMDPIEFRLKNLAAVDTVNQGGAPAPINRTKIYQDQLKIGAELIGWADRKPRGKSEGPVKTGYGVALHQWGGGGAGDKQVECMIHPDGSVEMRSATQDIGTGARTILAIIAAEVFGLKPTDVTSNIGNSTFKPGQASGGSTTTPSMAPPAWNAALAARDELFAKIAPALGAKADELSLKDGQVLVKEDAKMSWKDACRKLGMMPVTTLGKFSAGLSSNGVGGVQFAKVTVDTETGVVKVKKIVAVQDSGLIIDKLTWRSQVSGGVIGGLNYGLFEERVMDPKTGTMLNADLENYKLARASDIPEIVVKAYEPDEIKARGVIGVGEPPTISTAAAIANAVANAAGVRVPHLPLSPKNVLDALASQKGKA